MLLFHSWIFSESGAAAGNFWNVSGFFLFSNCLRNRAKWTFSFFTDAVEDVPKNISCIKNMTTYYSTKEDVLENGKHDRAHVCYCHNVVEDTT